MLGSRFVVFFYVVFLLQGGRRIVWLRLWISFRDNHLVILVFDVGMFRDWLMETNCGVCLLGSFGSSFYVR